MQPAWVDQLREVRSRKADMIFEEMEPNIFDWLDSVLTRKVALTIIAAVYSLVILILVAGNSRTCKRFAIKVLKRAREVMF